MKISVKTKIGEIQDREKVLEVLKEFEVGAVGVLEMSFEEVALEFGIPKQVLVNHVGKKLGLEIDWGEKVFENSSGMRKRKLVNVKKIFAIQSAKGGVGKTFVTANFAFGLSKLGFKVGVLDGDVDCPNLPTMMRIEGGVRLKANEMKKIEPAQVNGVKVVSTALILDDPAKALSWRGPVLSKAYEQLAFDTDWGNLDVLFVDMPPGTGEISLTCYNIFELDGSFMVSNSTKEALIDTRRTLDSLRKFDVKVLGVIGNMESEIFGRGGVRALAEEFGVEYLGEIELRRKYNDEGGKSVLKWGEEFDDLIEKVRECLVDPI